jgi:predicted RNA-binding Zn-ribbon protein involved in translation (DUF1610 family)
MKSNPEFISPCGLYCGVCAIHIAARDNNEKFKKSLVGLYKGGVAGKGTLPNSEDLSTADIHCQGCLSQDLFMHCTQCEIRDCTGKKGLSGCHECDEFPCQIIDNFPMAVGKRVMLRSIPHRRAVGTHQWVLDEQARYVCPECGNTVFRGVVRCNQCKTKLDLD